MKKSAKIDVNQLELDFEQSVRGLKAAVDRLAVTANALIQAGQAAKVRAAAPELDDLRARLHKVVKIQAASKRLTCREIYILLYERLKQSTGFNAVAQSVAHGDKYHLDAVQRAGLLPQLLDTAAGM